MESDARRLPPLASSAAQNCTASSAAVSYHAKYLDADLVHAFARLGGQHRELSLSIAGAPVPWRYQDVQSGRALRTTLERNAVERLELGAYFNLPPSDARRLRLDVHATARPLTIDVDIDAYDAPHVESGAEAAAGRRCCAGAARCCARCWPLVACALECIDIVLREQLALAHVLYVFSGRRGAHVWVCDPRALVLAEGARRLVGNVFLALGAALRRATTARGVAPADAQLYAVMLRHYAEFSRAQAELGAAMPAQPEPADVAAAMLPRLDSAVTAQLSHLLRAPLVAHPGNGGIAEPLPLATLTAPTFDPSKPLLAQDIIAGDQRAHARLSASKELLRALTATLLSGVR